MQKSCCVCMLFPFLVEVFIRQVLGVDADHRGLYGDTSAYYGTVEQQGSLTLHLHLLLWLRGSLNPQELQHKILDPNSEWQKQLIVWLESCQVGELLAGSIEEVRHKVELQSDSPGYQDPTETMPEPPPAFCKHVELQAETSGYQEPTNTVPKPTPTSCKEFEESCHECKSLEFWWQCFRNTVDDLFIKSNIHNCKRSLNKDGTHNKKHEYVGCLENRWGKCKARFPRPTFAWTEVNTETGALDLKKGEPWMNNTTPILTYLFRCNTDVTSLTSGTAIKAVVLYVSDYITKSSLKTHIIFDSIRAVFTKNREMIGGNLPGKEKACQLMTKVLNMLSTKMEMGIPMICMYLLGNPDHYTDHSFINFYWQSFVTEARRIWSPEDEACRDDKITVVRQRNRVIGLSPVFDYIYRLASLESLSLYDWVRHCTCVKIPVKTSSKRKKNNVTDADRSADSDPFTDELECSFVTETSANEQVDTIQHEGKGKLRKNMFAFSMEYPLYATHTTQLADDIDMVVVNFIGATLPRCDQGDHECYCAAMLTLFVPWRSGFDLKTPTAMWDETFVKYEFSSRDVQLMNNYNIRYECLDARDDYRAQLEKGAESLPNLYETDALE